MTRSPQRTRASPRPGRRRRAAPAAFSQLFEDASDIIILNDREGWVVAANRAAREFGGYSAAEVARGVNLRDVLAPEEFEPAMALTQRALGGLEIPAFYEREVVLRDGSRRVLELRSNIFRFGRKAATLLTIARDVTEKKDAAAFQAGLLRVAEALLTAQRIEQVGQVICEQAQSVLHAEGVYLWLRREQELIGCAGVGMRADRFAGTHYPVKGRALRALQGGPLVLNEFQREETAWYPGDWARDAGVQAMLLVPLRQGDGALGLLVFVDYHNARRFSPLLVERATIFAAQACVAVQSALAREREEEEGRVSTALMHVAHAIRESLEESDVLPRIARSMREAMGCDWVLVALWEAAKQAFRVTTTDGWPAEADEELKSLEFAPGTLQMVARILQRETVEIEQPRGRVGLYQRWHVGSLLAVPMVRAGRVIGALIAGYRERRGAFSTRERRIAEGVAAQAAVAVENARLVEALRRANDLKSEFLGMMSHELRTPLSAILGYADLMREGAMGMLEHEQTQVLDRMLFNGRGLLDLINMTLDVNRLEAGHIPIEATEFALDDLLHELRGEFAPFVNEAVMLQWPANPRVPPLYTDRRKLKLVLRNLIDNALKFTRAGTVTVRADYDPDLDHVRVAVSDTGIGIPTDALASIFEMFHQLNGSPAAGRGGVGLGLYLVRRYLELLGGVAKVASSEGEGSTFTAEFPRRFARPEGTRPVG